MGIKKHKDKDGLPVVLQQGQSVYQPLSIGSQNDFNLAKVNFSVSGKDIKLDENKNTGAIVFEYATSESSIRRTYTFIMTAIRLTLRMRSTGWLSTG